MVLPSMPCQAQPVTEALYHVASYASETHERIAESELIPLSGNGSAESSVEEPSLVPKSLSDLHVEEASLQHPCWLFRAFKEFAPYDLHKSFDHAVFINTMENFVGNRSIDQLVGQAEP